MHQFQEPMREFKKSMRDSFVHFWFVMGVMFVSIGVMIAAVLGTFLVLGAWAAIFYGVYRISS